jgi:hypothetical protein
LLEQEVHERGFAVVNVSDNSNVSDVLGHIWVFSIALLATLCNVVYNNTEVFMESAALEGVLVLNAGHIDRYGVVSILQTAPPLHPQRVRHIGLYAEELYRYAGDQYRVCLCEDSLEIIDKRAGRSITRVHARDLSYVVARAKCRVIADGYLAHQNGGPACLYDQALDSSYKGVPSGVIDPGKFVRVDPGLYLSPLTVLIFSEKHQPSLVFDSEGVRIPSTLDPPENC